jgi:AcrR family transcriptional regulator
MTNEPYLPGPERRRRILSGAKRVFAARGYHDTNISHICDDLGIARGTLYLYFRSKQDVFTAIIEGLLERVRAFIAAKPPLEIPEGFRPSPEQTIRFSARSLQAMLEAVFEDEASLRILVREAVGLDLQIDAILRAIDDIVVDRFASDLAVAQRAGVIRADVDPRMAALFTMGGVQKLALAALAGPDGGAAPRPPSGASINLETLAYQATRMQMLGLLAPVEKEIPDDRS